jgi:drug/metabolite transporter (DMT)-like permease
MTEDRRGAIVRAILAIAVLSAMDALVKEVAARYPTFEVTFMRFAAGGACVLTWAAWRRPGWPSRETVIANSLRSVLGVVTATAFFYSLSRLPMAEAFALWFLAPIFMAALAVVTLGERIDRRIAGGLAAGLAGMAVMVLAPAASPAARAWDGVAAGLLCALTYAVSMVLLRARATRDRIEIILLFQTVGPALIMALPAAGVWTPIAAADWPLFALIGVIGTAGQILFAQAFARAPASVLAPLEYTSLVWAVVFGYGIFGEVPSLAMFAGSALIIAGSVLAARR